MEQQVLDFINRVYLLLGWPGVVALMTIESACIPLPSEIIMPLAGWMLVDSAGLSVWFIVLAAFCGAIGNVFGSLISYWVGAKGGSPFPQTLRQIHPHFQSRSGAGQSLVRPIRRLDNLHCSICACC